MRFIALALAGLLTACGGGGDAQTPTAQQAQQVVAKQCRDVRLMALGDSVMQGFLRYTTDASLRNGLERYFDAHSTRHVVTIDRSVPGTTSTQLVSGTDGVSPAWPYKPDADILVVNFGLNDAARVLAPDYEHNLRLIASVGVPVVFQTPTPVPDPAQDTAGYAEIMRNVARDTGQTLADVYAFTVAMPDWKALIWDGAHPNQSLYDAMAAKVVGPALLPLVEATPCQ